MGNVTPGPEPALPHAVDAEVAELLLIQFVRIEAELKTGTPMYNRTTIGGWMPGGINERMELRRRRFARWRDRD